MTNELHDTTPVRLGIIGCGLIAGIHGEAAQTNPAMAFVACVDRNRAAVQAFAERFGCKGVYTSIQEMVHNERLDGVVLATWPAHHHEHIDELLEAGVRFVLCEKALTVNGARAARILSKADATNSVVIEAFMFRYHPLYQQLESLVTGGDIGRIDTIRSGFQEFDEEKDSDNPVGLKWRQIKDAGGGVGFDCTSYCLHACTNLAGSLPTKVSFDGDISRYDTLVRLHGYIRYENGITALIHSSLRAVVCKDVEVSGETGSLYLPFSFGFNIPEVAAIRKRTGTSNLTMKDEFLPRPDITTSGDVRLSAQLQLQHFVDVIRGNSQPRIPLAESVVNAFTLDAIIESATTGQSSAVTIPRSVKDLWLQTRARSSSGCDHSASA